jgi:hypothetical protein
MNSFIILGPIVDDAPSFWNKECGTWTMSKDHATRYQRDILTSPLDSPLDIQDVTIQEEMGGMPVALYIPQYDLEGMQVFEKII